MATLDQVHAATVQDQGAPVATLTAQPASTNVLGNALGQDALLS